MKFINLLKQQNDYLLQFAKISTQEYRRLRAGDKSHIQQFYHRRQLILSAIENIEKHLKKNQPSVIPNKDKATISQLLKKKREVTKSILQKDMLIHAFLNGSQNSMIKDKTA